MFESPRSLQYSCLETLCENLGALCESKGGDISTELYFNNSDAYLHCDISEKLLEFLGKKRYLNDNTLSLFDPKHTRLEKVKIENASNISLKALKILRLHKISELEISKLGDGITVNDLIGCLGEWTLQNLRMLNVRNNTFTSSSKFCVVVALSKLRTLQTLNVSNTEFNGHGLKIVAEDLPCLINLDISETRVKDISPLELCKHRLKSLSLYNLKLENSSEYIPLLSSMKNLRHLDISNDKDHPFHVLKVGNTNELSLLQNSKCLPSLVSLDISGMDKVESSQMRQFLAAHPNLEFLGLCETDICFDDMFAKESHPDYDADLFVTGSATEMQVLRSLQHYPLRPLYIQKSLYYLYSYTHTFTSPRLDVIKLILPAMKSHPKVIGIQMAATACLYNLTKSSKGRKVHPALLQQVVDLTLLAMENFPHNQQLHKNALLTLCSDRILQDVAFDHYHCARLVMDSLVAFEDPVMNKLSVAICSILAAKISTKETSRLGLLYMKRLLSIVKAKVEEMELDIMLKFTLSALWNLTDESPETCRVFLSSGGMELFLQILKNFPREFAVETKVLGLINNIAEVGDLRPSLLKQDFLEMVSSLLLSENIDVSYFAAGILSHLCSDTKLEWGALEGTSISRSSLLETLGKTVSTWKFPETEMVAYRSFHPFISLLQCEASCRAVQLWAVWAIMHVCSKNPKRYITMLTDERILDLLTPLVSHSPEGPDDPSDRSMDLLVSHLASDILALVTSC